MEKLAAVAEAERVLRGSASASAACATTAPWPASRSSRGQLARAAGEAREAILAGLHAAGFTYVALDLDGFRSGSMNEAPSGAPAGR